MKKAFLILSILPFLGSCDKNTGKVIEFGACAASNETLQVALKDPKRAAKYLKELKTELAGLKDLKGLQLTEKHLETIEKTTNLVKALDQCVAPLL